MSTPKNTPIKSPHHKDATNKQLNKNTKHKSKQVRSTLGVNSNETPIKKTFINTSNNVQTVQQIKHSCKVMFKKLKKHTDGSSLPTTTETEPKLDNSFGQTRAINALKTAFEISANGYHVFAVGENGLGKRTFITQYLSKQGHKQAPIADWIYVYNFAQPLTPLSIALKAGSAEQLAQDIIDIWRQLTYAFDHLKIQSPFIYQLIHFSYSNHNHSDKASIYNGKYGDKYDDNEVNLIPLNQTDMTHEIERLQSVATTTAQNIIIPLFDNLVATHCDNPELIAFLNQLKEDMIAHAFTIVMGNDERFRVNTLQLIPDRYNINVITCHSAFCNLNNSNDLNNLNNRSSSNLVTHSKPLYTKDGAPIVFENNPTISRLLGNIYQTTQSGTDICNHMMIQSGALHKANGGYIIIDAHHLIEQPKAWHELKLIIQAGSLNLADDHQPEKQTTIPLLPEPIPLNVKVILLGDTDLYDQFAEHDPDFTSIFKIRADFHNEVIRSTENELKMIGKMADIIHKYQINHFDNTAQALVLEHLSLQCEDQNKLSLHTDSMIQLMLESSRQADIDHSTLVTAQHVHQALTDMRYRSSYLKELYLQEITNGQQLISTSGTAIGQINALTIIDYANTEFGMPALLTAVVQHSVGSGDILDIERDVELGGSLHAKGMLIMNSYLRALFSPYQPLNFTASLAFEQSYAHIDGDSATLAEACALLSALADIPITQSLGITGSMNQLGRVQAVGGINAKVAGFFDACSHQGLTGNQGVILPYANITQLMLRDDIICAVETGKFHIYGVKTLSEALTILSNTPVDTTNKKGHYRKSSLFGKIINNLKKWEEQLNPPEAQEDSEQGSDAKNK